MEFKGTKGKWRVDVYVGNEDIETRNIVQVNGGITVCKINRFSPYEIPIEVQKANALLISKAPEMLELLQSLVSSEMTPLAIRKQAKQLIKEATEL